MPVHFCQLFYLGHYPSFRLIIKPQYLRIWLYFHLQAAEVERLNMIDPLDLVTPNHWISACKTCLW
jgi:hypothetical protein